MDSPKSDDVGFSGTQTAKIVGITYRQLDYWARTDLIKPSLEEAKGSGSRRRYSYRDLLELRVIKTLLDSGIRLESVRDVFSYLRQHVTTDISSANIVIQGTSVVLCENDELIDILRSGPGRVERPPARRREGRHRRQAPPSGERRPAPGGAQRGPGSGRRP